MIWDLIDNFFLAFNITFISIEVDQHEDSLVVDASTFKVTIIPQMKYYVEIRYKTSI